MDEVRTEHDEDAETEEETSEERNERYRHAEPDLLKGLFEAVEDKHAEWGTIEIARQERVLFSFRVRPLDETEYETCREKATTYRRDRRMGNMRVPEDTKLASMNSWVIFTATHPEDCKLLWNNREAWERFGVITGPGMVEKALLAGEKERAVRVIDELSGYDQSQLEETSKN
jgi:hypothetical protein